jgi:hypothetical protein
VSSGRASKSARKSVRKAWVASKAQTGKKARERRAGGPALAVEQGHEGLPKRQELLIERLERALAADGIAEEDGQKIDDLVVPATAG